MINTINFKKLKYLFIDFDGTLVDSVPILYDHYIQFLKRHQREGTREEFISLMGPSIEEFIPILAGIHGLEQETDLLVQDYINGLADRYKNEAKLMRGAKEFLKYASDKHLKLILVTSSPATLIDASLKELNLKAKFEHLITGDQVQKTKPDPEIYLKAISKTHATTAEILAIEDSDNGALSATRAGLPTILIHREYETTLPNHAIVIRNWVDLLKLFKKAYEK